VHVLGERAETILLPEPLVSVHEIAAAAPHRGKEAWFMSCVSKHGQSTFPWAAQAAIRARGWVVVVEGGSK
jgi:hypothetical protein